MTKPFVMGVDIGGTNTVFGVVDSRGQILRQGSVLTGNYATIEEYLNNLVPELNRTIEEAGGKDKFQGIGIGAPNANYYKGTIEDATNIRWADKKVIPFAELLKEAAGIPCALTNDANAAAIGEMTYGVAKGMKNFIMMTLGTGVGSGIVINGQLVYGYDGFAGELGHVIVRRQNGRLCSCGRKGCLEAYASASGILKTARELYSMDVHTAKDVHSLALQGDESAIGVFRYTGYVLGEAFADFVAFSTPEAIILFGGPSKAGVFLLDPIREAMENSMLSIYKGKTKLLLSQLPESDAAVLGASALGWEVNQ